MLILKKGQTIIYTFLVLVYYTLLWQYLCQEKPKLDNHSQISVITGNNFASHFYFNNQI